MDEDYAEARFSQYEEELSALRAEVERLKKSEQKLIDLEVRLNEKLDRYTEAVEWACGVNTADFYKCEHYLTWKRELRRRVRE